MRRALIIITVATLLVGAASAALALTSDEPVAETAVALQTQEDPDTTTTTTTDGIEEDTERPCGHPEGLLGFPGRGFGRLDLAELLGMEPEELRDALAEGATPLELAEERGIDLVAAFSEAAEERIAAAEAEGTITPEQADELRQRIQERAQALAEGDYFGWHGRGGHHGGFGGFGPRAEGTATSA